MVIRHHGTVPKNGKRGVGLRGKSYIGRVYVSKGT
jgi:hypothetical protein